MLGDDIKALGEELTAEGFAKEVLGFEEIQDDEEEEGTQAEHIMYEEGGTELVPEDPNEYDESPSGIGKTSQEIHV